MAENSSNKTDADDKTTVLITRRRWDCFFLIAFVIMAIAGIVCAMITGDVKICFTTPLGILPIWLLMRFKVPKNGQRWKTISGTPGAILSLIYLAVVLLMVVAFFFLDSWVLGQRFNDPPKWYHWVVLSFFLLLMCMGGVIIEHRYGSKKQLVTCQEGSNKIDENVSKKEL